MTEQLIIIFTIGFADGFGGVWHYSEDFKIDSETALSPGVLAAYIGEAMDGAKDQMSLYGNTNEDIVELQAYRETALILKLEKSL